MASISNDRAMHEPIPHSSPDLGPREARAVADVVRSRFVKGGARREELERRVAEDQGYAAGIATTTGSQAIHLALRLLFPGGAARVGLPSYVCRSVYDAVVLARCEPVLLDIDLHHFAPSIAAAKHASLDALIVAHMFGIRAPLEAFLELGLPVLEDCAQRVVPAALGRQEPRGSVRILSFEATKLMTSGEGGLLLLTDGALAERARRLRDGSYEQPEPALWLPLTDLQAALALVQWARLPAFLEKRRRLAAFYRRSLERDRPGALAPAMRTEGNLFFRFLLWVEDPDRFIEVGAEHGVIFRRPVAPMALHELFGAPGGFPATDQAIQHLVSIPLYPRLSLADARRVVDAVRAALPSAR